MKQLANFASCCLLLRTLYSDLILKINALNRLGKIVSFGCVKHSNGLSCFLSWFAQPFLVLRMTNANFLLTIMNTQSREKALRIACSRAMTKGNVLAPVVQTLNSAIHRINHYPADSIIDFRNTYLVDSDLSGGQCYPTFEQPGPDL